MALGGDKGRDMPGPAPLPAPPVPLGHPSPGCWQGQRGELQVSAYHSPIALWGLSWHLQSLGRIFGNEGPHGIYTFMQQV